ARRLPSHQSAARKPHLAGRRAANPRVSLPLAARVARRNEVRRAEPRGRAGDAVTRRLPIALRTSFVGKAEARDVVHAVDLHVVVGSATTAIVDARVTEAGEDEADARARGAGRRRWWWRRRRRRWGTARG